MELYDLNRIIHIPNVDHPESISVGPGGEAYTTGTAGQVYRLNLETNTAQQFASTAPRRVLGQAIDIDGNLYCADAGAGKVIRITQDGGETTYATGPGGKAFACTNYPAFDKMGNLYLSESGDWTDDVNGYIYKIPPGGGEAVLWYPEAVYTPNAVCIDAEEKYLYWVETFGSSICRIEIKRDGSAGKLERLITVPNSVPDGMAFDDEGRLWIAFHRPDSIQVFDTKTGAMEIFAKDWKGNQLRSPTDTAFAGPNRDILLAATLGNLCVHRFDNVGTHGLRLNHPKIAGAPA